ncbi:MAG: hypothetical protein MMC23_006581 [Stictis urceolatum]|nr:hypothetical protein [Stictis urceolata]
MASVSPNLPTTESPSQRFFQYFQLEATALQQQMARLKDVPTIGGERMDAIDHCLGGISRLQKEVQDAFSYTTAYDQKMYTEGIKALHEKLQETKTALAPKSKFSFKSAKKNNSAISLSDAAELAMQQHAHLLKPSYLSSGKSSLPPTPADAVTPPKDSQSKSIEPPDKDSLGRFLNAAGVQSVAQEDRPHSAVRKMSFTSSNEVNISAYTAVHIILPNSAAHATSSGSLTYLDRCIVDMSIPTASTQPFAALTVKDVKSSLLICGNCSSGNN